MALGDIYQLRDLQIAAYGTQIENVYFYIGTGLGLALNLAQAFEDQILNLIAAMQPADYNHYSLSVISLFDPSDFADLSVDVDGTWPVETSAPYTAVNFTLQLPTRAIRKGSKRIGPTPENAAQNGVIIDAGYLTAMEGVRAVLDNIISPTAMVSQSFQPVVVKRIKEIVDGETVYRLPTSFGEATYANVTGVTTSSLMSHQISRERVN